MICNVKLIAFFKKEIIWLPLVGFPGHWVEPLLISWDFVYGSFVD